jgi:hypothetical protein
MVLYIGEKALQKFWCKETIEERKEKYMQQKIPPCLFTIN